jgi:hypothetical protein
MKQNNLMEFFSPVLEDSEIWNASKESKDQNENLN